MLTIEINSIEYNVANSASEITLAEFATLVKVEKNAPAKLKALWNAETKEERAEIVKGITTSEYYKDFLPYHANWLHCLTRIPIEVLLDTDTEEVEALYNNLHRAFDRPEKAELKSFEHGGKMWYLPENLMTKSTFGEYSTAAHLQEMAEQNEGSYIHSLPKVCAILLREHEGQPFTGETALARAELFKSLTMDKVWAVDFFLLKRLQLLKIASRIYTEAAAAQKAQN